MDEKPCLMAVRNSILYDLRVRVYVGRKSERLDEYVVSFGLRAFTLDGKEKNDFLGVKAQKIEKNRKIFKFFFKNA